MNAFYAIIERATSSPLPEKRREHGFDSQGKKFAIENVSIVGNEQLVLKDGIMRVVVLKIVVDSPSVP
jgi:hypothetical protein